VELSKDYVIIKLSLVVSALFCIVTELKCLTQETAYYWRSTREALGQLGEVNHKGALEIARVFYPEDCPLRKHTEQTLSWLN
jgi:hypothetical protein